MDKPNAKSHIGDVKTLIVGVDLTEESRNLVREATQLADKLGAKLVLAHIIPIDPSIELSLTMALPLGGSEAEKERKNEVRDFYKVSAEVEVRFGRADDEINHMASKYENPLILVGHSSKGWLEKLVAGSVSKSLATHFDKPVLIF